MRRYDPEKHGEFHAVAEADIATSRRNILKLIAGSGVGALIGFHPGSGEAIPNPTPIRTSTVDSLKHYGPLRQRIRGELDAGRPPSGHDLRPAVSYLPGLFYEHDATKIVDAQGRNVPSPSIAFEVAKQIWFSMKENAGYANDRDICLDKLNQAAQPGVPIQKRLQQIYDDNYPVNNVIRRYWEMMRGDAEDLMKAVQRLVLMERSAAKSMKTSSLANTNVAADAHIPMASKDSALSQRHAANYDKYTDIQPWLRPLPYTCDLVTPDLNGPLSSMIEVEAIKTLQVTAMLHLLAAVQRKEAYHALQSYVQHKPKQRALLKYDGTRYNDPILYGWLELLREQLDANNLKGQIPTLLEEVIFAVRAQSSKAEGIKRCVG